MDALIIWLMVVNLMSQGAFSLLAPFYPDIATKQKGMSSTVVGLVMASFSLSFVVASFLVGIKISKLGRRFVLYLGIVLQGISMIGFGCIVWVPGGAFFAIMSFAFRLLGGAAWAFICVAAYAMVSIKYPEDVQPKISLLEAANGAGLFVGPIFGGLVYQFTHFSVPFILFTLITFGLLPFMKKAMGEELDRDDNKDNLRERLGYLRLLRNKRVFFSAWNQFFNIIMFTSGQPIIGPRLTDDYGFSALLVGVTFAIPTIAYALTGPLLLPLITKKFEARATMMLGFFVLVLSGFIVGPSSLFGFPSTSTAMMLIGLFILGMGAAFTVIPVIPEMLDAVEGQFDEHKSEISDNFSGIFNVAGGFGQIVGPSIAGALEDKVGFNWTFDIISLTILTYNIIYIIFWGGCGSISRSYRATAQRFNGTNEVLASETAGPTKHRLLESDNDNENENENNSGSDEEYNPNKMYKEYKSTDNSTDISAGGIN